MRIYWAAPIFSPEQIAVGDKVVHFLRSGGIEVFVPAEVSAYIWKGRAPKDCSDAERLQVFNGNWNNIDTCDVFIAWVGGGPKVDTGVAWELGYAFGNKENVGDVNILAYIDDSDGDKPMNLMLEQGVDGVAIGFEDLKKQIFKFKEYGKFGDRQSLSPEDKVVN